MSDPANTPRDRRSQLPNEALAEAAALGAVLATLALAIGGAISLSRETGAWTRNVPPIPSAPHAVLEAPALAVPDSAAGRLQLTRPAAHRPSQ